VSVHSDCSRRLGGSSRGCCRCPMPCASAGPSSCEWHSCMYIAAEKVCCDAPLGAYPQLGGVQTLWRPANG
jgi:hypothetical protein